MTLATRICFALFFIAVVAFLLHIWFHIWSPDIFVKLLLTDAAIFAVSFVYAFLLKEHKESEKISGKNGLD